MGRPTPTQLTDALRNLIQPDESIQIQELKLRVAALELEKTREQYGFLL